MAIEHTPMKKKILFVCTGNYYRSRFAEIIFNYRATALNVPWQAFSRGLKTGNPGNIGPISPYTAKALADRNISDPSCDNFPVLMQEIDLKQSDQIIALKRTEHYAMFVDKHLEWAEKVEYWEVHDVDMATPEEALPEIENLVAELIDKLRANP